MSLIHPIDEQPRIRVETNVGGKIVDLEAIDYREQEYKRNQQTEPRRRYVLEPLPGTEPTPTPTSTDAAPVVDEKLTKALKDDLSNRGLPEIKIPKPEPRNNL